MQDVPTFLKRKGLTFSGYLNPDRPAIVADSHAARLNYETYLFADSAARETFRGDVVRYCGLVTDPVTKERFRPHDDSPRFEHEKVTYLFPSEDSFDQFVADPEHYRLPGYVMSRKKQASSSKPQDAEKAQSAEKTNG